MAISIPKYTSSIFIVSALSGITLFTWTVSFISFHVGLNDFWGILFYADHIEWSKPASLYNGFFPIGYALLLKLFPDDSVIIWAFLANILAVGLLLAAMATMVYWFQGCWAATLAFITGATYPLTFRYANTVSPDIGGAAFVSLALLVLWKPSFSKGNTGISSQWLLLAGGFLGMSSLWRSHYLVLATILIVAYFLVTGIRPALTKLNLIIGFILVYLIQIVVNLLSGHGAFETAQKFNIYQWVYPVDLWRVPYNIKESLLEVLLAKPRHLFYNYRANLVDIAIYAWPAALSVLFCHDNRIKQYSEFALISILPYALVVALGGSPRASIAILSLFIPPIVFVLMEALERLKAIQYLNVLRQGLLCAALVGLLLGIFLSWLVRDMTVMDFYQRSHANFTQIEQILLQQGMTNSKEVFTDSFELYFPYTPPYTPWFNGGWVRYSLWGYNEKYPDIPIDSPTIFVKACVNKGIRFLVLTQDAKKLAPFLGDLFEKEHHPVLQTATLISTVGRFKVFELGPLAASGLKD